MGHRTFDSRERRQGKVRYLDTSGPSMARRSTRPWERRHLLSTDWGAITPLSPNSVLLYNAGFMLDLTYLRENVETARERLAHRGFSLDVDVPASGW